VIPTKLEKKIVAIRYRTLSDDGPKYMMEKGSGTGFIFPYGTLKARKPVLLTEGEFDALLVNQEAGDLIQAVTVGSATTSFSPQAKVALCFASRILVCGDNDPAGQIFANRVCGIFNNAEQVILPSRKDPTDYHLAGHSLRKWIKRCLTTN
jgi:hypothetical protein